MNTYALPKSFAALSAALLLAGAAQAATYTTEFSGNEIASFQIDHIEIVWSTSVAVNNPVSPLDLSGLSFSFYNDSNALVYTDNAIVGGVVQPIGGVARTLDDIDFSATSGTSIQSFDNDINQVQLNTASGATYNFYSSLPAINVAAYLNGTLQEDATFTVTGQNTTGAIPEPSTCAALTGLLGLGFAALRRKRA